MPPRDDVDLSFVEALRLIFEREDIWLCDDEKELTGEYPSICVYCDFSIDPSGILGDLRWPREGGPATVDPYVAEVLTRERVTDAPA